jgi:ATP-dependent DNA helicase RecQ
MHRNLHHYFGFSSFRPGQEEAIQNLLAGNHSLVVMPTGSGKSLIFQLSALHLSGVTLVISPLIALMKDQVDALNQRSIPSAYINSTLLAGEQSRRLAMMAAGDYRLVYIAPERLRNTSFLNAIRQQKVGLLAVDETHCISEWGHDFRPDYLQIGPARAMLGNPLTVALTATATPQVQRDIIRLLGMPADTRSIVTGFNRPNLSLDVRYANDLKAKLRALQECAARLNGGAAIVYCGTRRETEETADFLSEVCRVKPAYYHAGVPNEQRARVQEDFISGKTNCITATNAFGMGIDRSDVRSVIHFTLPSSLEAYYQEAGRAGRDGAPANATLLYQPQDRALQEFFIRQSELTPKVLSAIYQAFKNGQDTWFSLEDLSRITALHPVQVRVGLAELERAGALEHIEDEGLRGLYRKHELDWKEIGKTIDRNKIHLQNRQYQLEGIVAYAESNLCRRIIILKHFGDAAPPDAPECCDNCREQQRQPQTAGNPQEMDYGERAGLIILDSIRRLKIGIGKGKLAQILKGSKTQEIQRQKYDRSPYYGRLAVLTRVEVESLIDQVVDMGYLKSVGGEYPVLKLTPKGESALANKSPLPLKLSKQVKPEAVARKTAERAAGGTYAYTAQLFANGMPPEEIARTRGLTVCTIYGHFARLIAAGQFSARQVFSQDLVERVEAAIQQAGAIDYLFPIYTLLNEEVDYNIIRCVVEDWKRSHPAAPAQVFPASASIKPAVHLSIPDAARVVALGNSRSDNALPELILALTSNEPNVRRLAASALGKVGNPCAVSALLELLEHEDRPQVRQYALKALGTFKDGRARPVLEKIAQDENEVSYNRGAARNALMEYSKMIAPSLEQGFPPGDTGEEKDAVAAFLSKSHPRPLEGPWQCGWALGFHSRFSGGDWSRSGVGSLTFRLKYRGDQTVIPALVEQALTLLHEQPVLKQVDFIVPVPPSAQREMDPVSGFCQALGKTINLPVRSVLTKSRQTQPQKELKTLAQKRANVRGAFALKDDIKGKDILLVDDLFDSGATLEEIHRLLIRQGAACVCILTLTRTIHADA